MDTQHSNSADQSFNVAPTTDGTPNLIEAPVARGAQRLAAVFALGLLFLGVASLVKPDPRGATAAPGTQPGIAPGAQTLPLPVSPFDNAKHRATGGQFRTTDVGLELTRQTHPKNYKLLGRIEDRDYHVLAYAAPDAPRYTVFSLEGRLLQADMLADDVYRSFPTLNLTTLRVDPEANSTAPTAIMLADPRD